MASVASDGTTDRIAARTLFKLPRAGSGTRARYSSTLLGVTCFFIPLKQQGDSLKSTTQHYEVAATDPKKILYYDTGHDLNDPQALEDRYDWLVKHISWFRTPGLGSWFQKVVPMCWRSVKDYAPNRKRGPLDPR